jgi:hypothetical protein
LKLYGVLLSHQDTSDQVSQWKAYSSTHQNNQSDVSGITYAKVQAAIDISFYGFKI